MRRQDNPKPSAGAPPKVEPVAAGAPLPDPRRASGPRDGLVLLSILIVSVALSVMLFTQFGLALPFATMAGAGACAIFLLIHKQVQKSAQIAQLKAELARTRVQVSRPARVGVPRGASISPISPSEPEAGAGAMELPAEERASLGSAEGNRLQPQAATFEAGGLAAVGGAPEAPPRSGLWGIIAEPGKAASQTETGPASPLETTGTETIGFAGANRRPAADVSPSVAPADVSAEGDLPASSSDIIRDQWSFRPRVDSPESGLAVAGLGRLNKPNTIEGDLELVQRKIRELADEVNAAEMSRTLKAQRSEHSLKLKSDAIEHSIGALRAAAGSMRGQVPGGDYVPTLSIPQPEPSPAAKSSATSALGELVIPATAQRIAGSDLGPQTGGAAPRHELSLPELPFTDAPSNPAQPATQQRYAAVAHAVEVGQMDVFLAPIVTLQTHSVTNYEMTVALKAVDGTPLNVREEDFALIEGEAGARYDIARLHRAAMLSLRLEARDKDGSLFTEFMGSSFNSRSFLEAVAEIFGGRPRIAAQLVVTLSQRAVDGFGAAAWQAVRDMRDFGFRFALDGVEHMRTDLAALAQSGFRFAKIDAKALIDGIDTPERHISANEIYQRMTLAGLSIIAEGISTAEMQKALLEAGVVLGQGPLFGAARLVTLDQAATPHRSVAA